MIDRRNKTSQQMPGSCFLYSIAISAVIPSPISFGVAIMALGACGCMKGLGMAGAATASAVVHTAAPFICNPRVGASVFCRPVVNRMTGNAVQSKQTGMVGWVSMAA